MTKKTKATVKGSVLAWARASAGYNAPEAAHKLGVEVDQLEAWEADQDHPSIPQLRKVASLYRRPLAVFYLPDPPVSFQAMSDFRRLPDAGPGRFSPGLTQEIRSAHQRRELALEMLDELGERAPAFSLTAALNDSPETVARTIREALGITHQLQSHWRDPLAAFRAWRSRIERQGVLVFQASRIESGEASGFAYWAEPLPFMVVNTKDTYPRRVFSLLHELAHLTLHQSGVSDLDAEGPRRQDAEGIEVFCNQVAATTLMPRDVFLAEPIVSDRGVGQHDWSDDAIKALADTFSVSREAIVRRLVTFGRASEAFYGRKREQYAREFAVLKQRQKEKIEGKTIPRNMPRETIATYGPSFVRMVLDNYHADRITLSDVSGYLGMKVRHLPGIEQSVELN
jgi:Zn-dependent peptidase ImmA (M78 family)/transcriptional regulator with XRE-family HTH domain